MTTEASKTGLKGLNLASAKNEGTAEPTPTPTFGADLGGNNNENQDVNLAAAENQGTAHEYSGGPDAAETAKADIFRESEGIVKAEPADPADERTVSYSSFPIQRFGVGRFEFENGLLTLNPVDATELDQLLANADPRTKNTVKKIDASAAEAHFIANYKPQATKSNDSSVEAARTDPIIGTKPVTPLN